MASTPYKHFVPPVPLNPDYDKNFTYVLIETLDQLKDSFQKGVVIAWDTETTGLNPVESEIVGFSYSYDGQTGYYCPVKHFDLALGKPALDLFYQALKDAKLQLLYNARFDIRMMEYSGYDMSFLYPKNPDTNLSQAVFIDVMNQVWLADTNIPLPSLKSSTLHFLGYQPPKFLETLGDEQNFKYVPAKDAYRYACFTADTLIQTKHGLKQISELKPNVDLIKTSDGYRRLLNVLDQGVQKVIRVTTPIGISFTCTPDHKFAMEIDHCICWVEAKDLDKTSFHKRYCGGQSLYGIEKSYTPSPMVMDDENACKIEYLDESQHVYDLTIDEEHNFFLQCGLIAHNCLDAINTMNLFKVTYRFYKESGKAAQLDNACVYIIGQLEKTPLNINTDYLVDLRDKVYSRVLELEQEIYSIAGHPFKIGSNRELTLVFQEQGIDTGERTKAGDMKTGIELLNMYLRNHPECTLLKLLIEYKEQFKFYNSYLKTLVDIAKKQDTVPPRFSYKLQSVPCLTENNLVLIRDKGITHIPEVKEQDYIWTQYGYKRVLWCNSHKTEDVYRVTFENAVFIEGTAHHPVLVNKGTEINPELEWATLESLKEGERVIFNHHTPPLQYSDDPKEKELSKYLEYLGYLIAVNIEPSVQYQVDWIETRDDLFKQASEEFRQMTHTIMSNPGYLFDLVIKSKPYQWIHFLQGIFFSVFETPVAQTWNNSMMDEFILRSQTPLLLTFLMNILSYLGIPTSLAYDDDSFFIIFNTSQSLTLLKTLIITDSNSHYLKSLFQNYNPFNYFIEYADSKVKAKEKMEGEHTVYDIEVEDVHEYVANGIVTHNTGRLATGKDGKNTYFAPINLQCLEENTLIKTERGNIPIKKVTEKDLVWTGTRFVPCKPLGSKQKECFKIKTLWGEIEASLEHRFLTLNIYDDYKIEWHTLAECISRKLPLVKDPQSLGIQFDDLYNHPTYSVIGNLRKELDLDRYRKVAEFYKSYKFDIIIECPWQFWKPDLYPFPELTRTVYDLYVPEYNQFTANGFIVHNSLPKPKSIKCYARKATPEEIENKQDVLGWMFSPDHPEWSPGKVVEGMDQHLNVRAAFLPEHPENGDYVVSCDMCLEAGSPVQTKRGYLGISELKVGDEIYSPQGWVEVIRVMQTGIKKLIKVLPDNGGQALYCTEDHHFPIDGKKIEARDIKTSLPSIPFYSYNEEIEKRDLTETKLSMLKMCKTPKEKANYIIANDLKDFFISSIQKYTRANIARWTGTKVSSFGHILDYLGIHKTNKRYAFKVDLFYNNPFIDSSNPTSAYLFGYILGDGNIHERKNGTSTLNITSKDKAHLTRIIEIFGKDTKMRKHSRDDKEWWSIDITDQGICKRLKELGISMRKSTEPSYVDFTWIGDNFRHFIRGLFDSDGYVRVTSCLDLSFVGHDSYIKEIQKRIDGDWGYKYTQSLSYLFLHGRVEQKKFIHAYLYQGATIWLQRKRDIIEQWYLEHFGDIIWPVWNCTVNTPEHLYYANAISTSNCAEELRVVTNLFKEESWARIINSGGDLHHANSDAIFGQENYTKETRKKAKCISGKSLIFTTEGIKKLEDLCYNRVIGEPQPIDLTIATPEGLCKATHFIYNGERSTKVLYFKDGTTLEATPDHIIQSNKKLKKIEDLCVGDTVDCGGSLIEVNNYQEIDLPFITGCKLPITEDIAYLLGAILGDGSLNKKNVKYMSIDSELIEEVKRIVFLLNLSDKEPYIENLYRKNQPRKIPVTYINCGSKRLLILLECLGINKSNHKELTVPEIIFKSPSSVRGKFIRGLFDTDGWVGDKEFTIGFCTKSLSFAQGIHYLLLSLGISNTIAFSYNKVYNRNYYKIRIAQVSSQQFFDKVGFYNHKKRDRLIKHLDGYRPNKPRIPKKEIVKIEDSKSEVFDLTIDNKSHLFYANSFIVHNCAAFGMLYGQEYRGFQRKFPDMSLDEAKEFMIKFKRTIPHIVHGQDRMIKDARRTGTFYSGFGRPRRVKHYLTSPDYKDVAFGERTCYSPDTEFLTKDGWKLAKNIKVDTLIAYYDPETKNTKFTEAGERITSISTESIQYLGSSYAWNVTPNHRMWIRGTSKERFRFVEAEYLLSITSCQAVGASYLDNSLEEDSDIETPIGVYNREDVAELFGWLLTDGSISKKLDTISIGQTKSANFKRLETLVSKFHGHVSYRKPSNLKEKTVLICRICNKAFSRWVIEQLQGRLKVDRHIPEWIFLSDIKVREKFIEAMLLGDGRIRKDKLSGSFDTPSKSIADRFQIILNLSGYRSIVRSYKNRNSTQMYAVTYCRKEYTNMDFRKRKNGVSNLQKVEHEPLEYSCFTVPTSILITRYKGKISYMGNCKNGPIQSTAADVLKLELVRLWDNLFTVYPEYKFIVTIHDEIDVSIPRHLANEIIPKMIRCMTVQRPSDLVPLDCSLSCGPSLGAQYEMVYNFDTKEFEPKWEEDKRIETQENTPEETENNEVDEEKDEIEDSISYEDDLVEEIDSKMFDF